MPQKPAGSVVLLTGGTGFIGSYVVRALREGGVTCRLLSRRQPAWPPGEAPPEHISGDILDRDLVDESMRGVSGVIHCAAAVSASLPDPSLFREVNVTGTRNVVQAAARGGIASFVHVSSCSAIDFRGEGILDEKAIVPRVRNVTEYGRTKAMAEEEVERASAEGLHTTIVYPTRLFGIGALTDANAATRAIAAHLGGRLPLLPGGGARFANWGYVNDIAAGMVKALFRGRAGARYILGGENASLQEVLAIARSVAGRHPVRIPIPLVVGRTVASLEEIRARFSGSQPRLTRAWYDSIFEDTRLSCALAMEEIGYEVSPLKDAMEEVVRWLVEGGPGIRSVTTK
jgi:nucleoside-diphosphate-sugar epimerase